MNAGTEVPCSFRLALLAVAVFAVAVFAVCGASDADAYSGEALEKDGFTALLYGDDSDYDLRVVMYDGSDNDPLIPDQFEYDSKVFYPTYVDVSLFEGESYRSPAKMMTELTLPDTVETVTGDFSIFKKLDTIYLGVSFEGSVSQGTLGFLNDVGTLERVDVADGNVNFCSLDGVVFTDDRSELLFYPPEKDSESFTVPSETVLLSDLATIHVNKYLATVTVASGNTVFASKDGVLYDIAFTRLILFPSANGMTELTIPNGVVTIEMPITSSYLTKVVFPSSFGHDAMEIGLRYGYLKIPENSLVPVSTSGYSLSLDKAYSLTSEVSKASKYDFYRISLDGANLDGTVGVKLYQVRYLASNLHILHVDEEGNATEISGVERSRTGVEFPITETGYYTYTFNDTTTIENAPMIALIIAGAGTVVALITILRNSRRQD